MPESVRTYELVTANDRFFREGWQRILQDISSRPKRTFWKYIRDRFLSPVNDLVIVSVFSGETVARYAFVRETRAQNFEQAVRSEYGNDSIRGIESEEIPLPEVLRLRSSGLERGDIFPLSDDNVFERFRELAQKHPDEEIISIASLGEAAPDWASESRVRALLSETGGVFAWLKASRWYSTIRVIMLPFIWFYRGFRFLFDPFPQATPSVKLLIPETVVAKCGSTVLSATFAFGVTDDGRSSDSILPDAIVARLSTIKTTHTNRLRLAQLHSLDKEALPYIRSGQTGTMTIAEIAGWCGAEPKAPKPVVKAAEEIKDIPVKRSRAVISPEHLAMLSDADHTTPIGTMNTGDQIQPFGIPLEDRKRHVYMIGKTGTGKTTLLANMLLHDIHAGRGVALIDPHGDLSRDILARIPSKRTNDVVFFDASDADFPSAFNLFAGVSSELRGAVASGIVSIFKRMYGNSWGPRLEYILRNAVLSLLSTSEPTLLSVVHILTDAEYRARVVAKLDDPVLKNFWTREFDRMDRRQMTEATAPILNKVGQFLANPLLRNIVLQPKNAFSPRWIMDTGKILIVRIPKGTIGEDTMSFLGSLLVTKFQIDAMSRANLSPEKRKEFCLYIDEFQNFASESFEGILSEGRKFGLSLVLGNQYVSQIPDEIARAVFGNVASILAFQTGPMDAGVLSKVMDLDAGEASKLQALPRYHILAKLNLNGMPISAFEGTTLPPPDDRYPAEWERAYAIERVCREKYAKPREFVEKKIRDRIGAMDSER